LDVKEGSMNRLSWVVTLAASTFLPALAWAGDTVVPLPEPGTFELLALGGAVAAVIAIRKWRSK
jgi:hypothetical protein